MARAIRYNGAFGLYYQCWAVLTNFREALVFGFFRSCVRTTLVLTFSFKQEAHENSPGYHIFFQGKKIWFSSLTVLNNSRTSQFSWLVLTSWISEISMYFFENYYYYYYIIFFWDKIIDIEGVGKLRCTQFDTNLELHIISKVATRKISPTLNNF